MDEDKEAPRGFRVTDRRRFSDEGEAREATEGTREDVVPPAPTLSPDPAAHGVAGDEPVTFSTLILGLSTQALLHLGEIPNPVSGQVERDLAAAKHVIDIVGVLADKTKNNLDQAEQALLDSILYDLRMRYVELVRMSTKEGT